MGAGGFYEDLLAERWADLAPGVRLAHTLGTCACGHMSVRTSSTGRRGFVARRLDLPVSGEHVPTTLEIQATERGARWVRHFGVQTLVTHQFRRANLAIESFGSFQIELRVTSHGRSVRHDQVGLCWHGIRLPSLLGPRVTALVEPGDNDMSWTVSVTVSHLWLGEICHYSGAMKAK